jgi:hypothetical protein
MDLQIVYFFLSLFNAFNSAVYTASNDRMLLSNGLERMWKEDILSQHLHGEAKENK